MTSTKVMIAEFEARLQELLASTAASRVTIRLDVPERQFHVDDVVAEARRPGVKSLKHETSIDQRKVETVRWLDRERRILVQDDLRHGDPAPPEALVAVYGTRAQMLAPLIKDDSLVGWISVHHNDGPREWTEREIASLKRTEEWFWRRLEAGV